MADSGVDRATQRLINQLLDSDAKALQEQDSASTYPPTVVNASSVGRSRYSDEAIDVVDALVAELQKLCQDMKPKPKGKGKSPIESFPVDHEEDTALDLWLRQMKSLRGEMYQAQDQHNVGAASRAMLGGLLREEGQSVEDTDMDDGLQQVGVGEKGHIFYLRVLEEKFQDTFSDSDGEGSMIRSSDDSGIGHSPERQAAQPLGVADRIVEEVRAKFKREVTEPEMPPKKRQNSSSLSPPVAGPSHARFQRTAILLIR
jgi:hypothetical protein